MKGGKESSPVIMITKGNPRKSVSITDTKKKRLIVRVCVCVCSCETEIRDD